MNGPASSRRPDPAPLRAVVVDDEPDERDLVSALLASAGAEVRSAATISAALAAIEADPPDVVLVDLSLGRESGVDLARRVRALPAAARVAIVAVTGHVEPEWSVVRHFDSYLRKPIDAALLVRVVAQLAQATRAAAR